MEKLTEQNRAEVEAYISAEPEYNVFVQGDLENYGFESKTVEIFGTRAADGALCALLLRYFNNYCLCMSGTAPVEELAAFLQARGAQYLSGKEADVAALAARMPGWKLRGTNLARMDRLAGGAALPEGFSLRMLGPQDAQAVIGLEVQYDAYLKGTNGKILTMTDARGVEVVSKGNERNQRGIIVDDNTSILQPDKGNINADTNGNGLL